MVDSFFGTPDLGVIKGDEIVGEVIVGDENVDECGNSLTEGPVCLAGRAVGSVVGGGDEEIVGNENVDEGGNSLTEGLVRLAGRTVGYVVVGLVRNYSCRILINYLKIGTPNYTSSIIKSDTLIIRNISLIKIRFY